MKPNNIFLNLPKCVCATQTQDVKLELGGGSMIDLTALVFNISPSAQRSTNAPSATRNPCRQRTTDHRRI